MTLPTDFHFALSPIGSFEKLSVPVRQHPRLHWFPQDS